jgi:hypothetical protein
MRQEIENRRLFFEVNIDYTDLNGVFSIKLIYRIFTYTNRLKLIFAAAV